MIIICKSYFWYMNIYFFSNIYVYIYILFIIWPLLSNLFIYIFSGYLGLPTIGNMGRYLEVPRFFVERWCPEIASWVYRSSCGFLIREQSTRKTHKLGLSPSSTSFERDVRRFYIQVLKLLLMRASSSGKACSSSNSVIGM